MAKQFNRVKKQKLYPAVKRRSPVYQSGRTALLSILSMVMIFLSGCTTTYFHQSTQYSSERGDALSQPMTHAATQHDGIVTMLSADNSIELETTCGKEGWQTIKTETNFMDIVIRAIANPVWGTQTVEYSCKDSAVAHIEAREQYGVDVVSTPSSM